MADVNRYMPIETGTHKVSATEASATAVVIEVPYALTGFVVTICGSDKIEKHSAKISYALDESGDVDKHTLKIENNSSTFVLANNDIINYICY